MSEVTKQESKDNPKEVPLDPELEAVLKSFAEQATSKDVSELLKSMDQWEKEQDELKKAKKAQQAEEESRQQDQTSAS